MNITLREIPFPGEQMPVIQPQVPQSEYVQRVDELYRKAGTDWVIVYGDREHLANLKFLTNYDPRFEEALLLIGPS